MKSFRFKAARELTSIQTKLWFNILVSLGIWKNSSLPAWCVRSGNQVCMPQSVSLLWLCGLCFNGSGQEYYDSTFINYVIQCKIMFALGCTRCLLPLSTALTALWVEFWISMRKVVGASCLFQVGKVGSCMQVPGLYWFGLSEAWLQLLPSSVTEILLKKW